MESDVYDGKRWFCEKSWLMCRYLFFAVLKNLEKIPKINFLGEGIVYTGMVYTEVDRRRTKTLETKFLKK